MSPQTTGLHTFEHLITDGAENIWVGLMLKGETVAGHHPK